MTSPAIPHDGARPAQAGYSAVAPQADTNTDAVVEHLSPIQARYAEIIEEEGYLDGVLKRGADAANEVAEKTVADVRDAMGFMERIR